MGMGSTTNNNGAPLSWWCLCFLHSCYRYPLNILSKLHDKHPFWRLAGVTYRGHGARHVPIPDWLNMSCQWAFRSWEFSMQDKYGRSDMKATAPFQDLTHVNQLCFSLCREGYATNVMLSLPNPWSNHIMHN